MIEATLRRLVRFGAVGGAVTLIGYLIFLAGIALGLGYLPSSLVAWVICMYTGFVGHRDLTFHARNSRNRAMTRYIGMSILILILGTMTLSGLIDYVGLKPWLAYPINVAFTASLSFVMMSRTVFDPTRT